MKHTRPFDRPALAAVAAVIALSSTPAFAQPDAVVGSDPSASAPAAPLPVLPEVTDTSIQPAAPPAATVQAVAPALPELATARVPTTPVARPDPVAARTASAPVAARQARPARQSVEPAQPLPVAARAPVDPVGSTEAAKAPAPIARPPIARPIASAEPARDETVLWALGGGGLLVASGLAAWALTRRRQSVVGESDYAPVQPVPGPVPENAMAAATASPVSVASPSYGIMTSHASVVQARQIADSDWPELDEMVAAPPSADNPFLTRSKRLRRAKFLLEHGESQMPEAQIAAAVAAPAAAPQTISRPQPVYHFGQATSPRRPSWKPAST